VRGYPLVAAISCSTVCEQGGGTLSIGFNGVLHIRIERIVLAMVIAG